MSSLGRVRSPYGPLTPSLTDDGYPRVEIAGEKARVAHLVLEAFDRLRPYGMEACHDPERSEGRHDCRAIALRWDTHLENIRDKRRNISHNGTSDTSGLSYDSGSGGTAWPLS